VEVRVSRDLDLADTFRTVVLNVTLLDCVIVSDCFPIVTITLPNNAERVLSAYSWGPTHRYRGIAK
jgi:hypothetical protein